MKKIVMLSCPTIQKVADRLAAEGVVLVDGTH